MEWTPETRKIREAEREAARAALRSVLADFDSVERRLDRMFPAPPPEYTYGREIIPPFSPQQKMRRRSDGLWQYLSFRENEWYNDPMRDTYARQLAAEVPLTDAECDALTLSSWSINGGRRAFIRATFVRVMRGEVK